MVFRQLRAKRAAAAAAEGDNTPFAPPKAYTPPSGPASTPPVETIAPGSTGTAAGDPIAGLVEEAVEETPTVDTQTEAPAVTATEDGELHTEAPKSD